MRTLNISGQYVELLDNAVEVIPHDKARFIYVDVAAVDAVPAIALPEGVHTRENVLKEIYGHLRNHVAPYNEKDVNQRQTVTRVEIHAVDNLNAVAEGEAPHILATSIGTRANRRGRQTQTQNQSQPQNAAGVQTGRTWVLPDPAGV